MTEWRQDVTWQAADAIMPRHARNKLLWRASLKKIIRTCQSIIWQIFQRVLFAFWWKSFLKIITWVTNVCFSVSVVYQKSLPISKLLLKLQFAILSVGTSVKSLFNKFVMLKLWIKKILLSSWSLENDLTLRWAVANTSPTSTTLHITPHLPTVFENIFGVLLDGVWLKTTCLVILFAFEFRNFNNQFDDSRK